ncbi:MSHA pilin protein MshD [Massilia sp. UYP11]|uniref:type IV pilus modification PilV family protein n=1 Tax=Massilia sp. UYP11 TaxID=1756385 RepID=UPI003D20BA93
MSIKRMAGMTLVELIIAIVIVGTALAGLVAVYNRANVASADPLITQQMLAIAETMMEEVMLKPYMTDGSNAPQPAIRADYTEIDHYNGYATSGGIVDVAGDPVAGLGRYDVAVSVTPTTLTNIANAADVRRIQVVVTERGGQQLQLTGWRTKPWQPAQP